MVRLVALIMVLGVQTVAPQLPVTPTLYPNELPGLELYARYFSPLVPYVSSFDRVQSVLGPVTDDVVLGEWTVGVSVLSEVAPCSGKPLPPELVHALADIQVLPNKRVPLAHATFSDKFLITTGSIDGCPVPLDVMSDSSGLSYWLYSCDTGAYKKGDLYCIIYGPTPELASAVRGCPSTAQPN